jgi:hypothetical protein
VGETHFIYKPHEEEHLMDTNIDGNPWVWVIVLDPGGNEQFLGQHDEEKDESFIPTFLEKEDAVQGAEHLVREAGQSHEVQAIRYEELAQHAAGNGFMLFILDKTGRILEKIEP